MRIRGRESVVPTISQVSLSDVAFLLLIFFLSTTIFDDELGLPIVLPELAASGRSVTRGELLAIELDGRGGITIDGSPVLLEQIEGIIVARLARAPGLVVVVSTAGPTPYGAMIDVLDEVRHSGARRVSLQPVEG